MNKGGVLVYRCRACGQCDRSIRVLDAMLATILISQGQRFPSQWGGTSEGLFGMHNCKQRTPSDIVDFGLTDFIGAEVDLHE